MVDNTFLRDRVAFWFGIKTLIDKKMVKVTPNMKKELRKTQEYLMQTEGKNALKCETTKKLLSELKGISLEK